MKFQDDEQNKFKKGMTLNEYLFEMKTPRQENDTDDDHEENLYQTSRKVKQSLSKKLITYEIRESDQDNYDESNEDHILHQPNNLSTQLAFYDQRKSNKNIVFGLQQEQPKNSLNNSRGFRVRRQSNSPFNHLKKESSASPNKSFSRTLHGNEWKTQSKDQSKNILPSTTLYGKFLKGLKDKEGQRKNSKQKYFKKKNNNDIEYVIKYQRQKNSKYTRSQGLQMLDMRVQGITDRLIDRKQLHGKSII